MARTMPLSEWCAAAEARRISAATAVYRVNSGQRGHNYSPTTMHWWDLPTPQDDVPMYPNCRDMLSRLVEKPQGLIRCGCLRDQFRYWWPSGSLMELLERDTHFCITVEVGPEMAVFERQVVFETETGKELYLLTVDWADLENEAVERFFWH